MSKGLQSPGGRAATDSAAQSGSLPLRAAPAAAACAHAAALADVAATVDSCPLDPARVKLAVAALCDLDRLAEQASMFAADLYTYEGDGRALVLQLLSERIGSLAACACTLLDDPTQPLDELEQVVHSSRRPAEGGAPC